MTDDSRHLVCALAAGVVTRGRGIEGVPNQNTVLARAGNSSAATANNVTEIFAPRVVRFGIRLRF